MTTITLNRALVERILADMRLASADKHGYRRMLIHELEAVMAAGTQGEQEPSAEAIQLMLDIKGKQRAGEVADVLDARRIDAFAARKVAEAVAQEWAATCQQG